MTHFTVIENSPGALSLFRTRNAPSGCSVLRSISSAFVLDTFPTYQLSVSKKKKKKNHKHTNPTISFHY